MKPWEWIVLGIVILWLIDKSHAQASSASTSAPALSPTHPLSDLMAPIARTDNFFEPGGSEDVIYIQGTPAGSGGSSGGGFSGGGGGGGGGGSTGGGTGRLK